jgi:regulator of sirC expression with transglutaminase-like and TPR domain
MSLFDVLQNPRGAAFKKVMYEFLKERYPKNEKIIERLSQQFLTEEDLHAFLKLTTDICEMGYLKAVEDYRDQLTSLGLKARIVPTKS